MEVLIKGCFINRIKVSCRRVYLFLVSLETSWIFRHWIFVALLWVLPETLAVNQRNNTVIKTFSNQFQRINTVMWQDEEPGSMTPYLSLCQHFFNSVLIKCNNLGEIWAINRTLCDPVNGWLRVRQVMNRGDNLPVASGIRSHSSISLSPASNSELTSLWGPTTLVKSIKKMLYRYQTKSCRK